MRLAPGATAYKFDLSGGSAKYADFDGKTLSNIRLTPGNVAIFRIDPRIAYIACSARYSG